MVIHACLLIFIRKINMAKLAGGNPILRMKKIHYDNMQNAKMKNSIINYSVGFFMVIMENEWQWTYILRHHLGAMTSRGDMN